MTIQCTEISSIRKEKTALVIPNAVQVCTELEKVCTLMSCYLNNLVYSSFVSPDQLYYGFQSVILERQIYFVSLEDDFFSICLLGNVSSDCKLI